jgi:acetyl-CoA carboxylase biotin carboxyl carrier protein
MTGGAVADEPAKTPSPFDVKTIKYLVGLMSQHDLSEIDLREGDLRIRLRRGSNQQITVAPSMVATPIPAPTAGPPPTAAPAPPIEKSPSRPETFIKSPTPGTFYASPSPEAEAFVKVGSRVTPSTVVCIIEAMKIFNEIQAECSGVITEVLVENQQPVEYGQPLFKVDPTG